LIRDHFVVDADSHVLEPPDLWKRYIDPKYRDAAPYVHTDESGHDTLRIGAPSGDRVKGNTVFEQGVGHLGAFGAAWDGGPLDIPYLECRGGYDPDARIAHMDSEGIDRAVLFPGIGLVLGGLEPDFAAACYRAYNRWLSELCRTHPERLIGAAMVPLQSVEHAIAEVRYAREELGLSTIFVRPNAYGGRMHHHPDFRAFWAEVQDLDVSVAIHSGSAGDMPSTGLEQFGDWFMTRHIVTHTMDVMLTMLSIVFCGVADQFPGIRFAFFEGGGGWVAGWLDRMDRHFQKVFYNGSLTEKPSNIFKRQCWIAFDPAEAALPHIASYIGHDRILWASDYPHPDGVPNGTRYILDNPALSAEAKRAILGDNALAFYGLTRSRETDRLAVHAG
jgi:uncharacterized protein